MKKYYFDHNKKILTASEAFIDAAAKYGSPEYGIITKLRKDFPDMEIEIEIKTRKTGKNGGISYTQMKQFIGQCRDAKKRMKAFNTVYELSKAQASPYTYMKRWFLENYANYSENPEFDADGFVIVKTKTQMNAEQQIMASQNASERLSEDAEKPDSVTEQDRPSVHIEKIPSEEDAVA